MIGFLALPCFAVLSKITSPTLATFWGVNWSVSVQSLVTFPFFENSTF